MNRSTLKSSDSASSLDAPSELLPQQWPWLQPAWPANNPPLPLDFYQPKRPDRTSPLASQSPLLEMSSTDFKDGHCEKHQQPCSHSSRQFLQYLRCGTRPTQCPLHWLGCSRSSPRDVSWSSFWWVLLPGVPANTYYMFGSTRSVWHFPLPSNLTHYLVVINSQPSSSHLVTQQSKTYLHRSGDMTAKSIIKSVFVQC